MMWKRVRQFIRACQARITQADRGFISEYLTSREQELYYGMNLPDQYHCLRVAEDCIRLAAGRSDVDCRFLARCALLHDVGRRRGDVATSDKIAAVLLHGILPGQAKAWARAGKGTFLDNRRHALYVYFSHPERSVMFLGEIGAEPELLSVVGAHHRPAGVTDPIALKLLRQADELN